MRVLSGEEYEARFADPFVFTAEPVPVTLTEPEDIALPARRAKTHKYTYGRALILAGSVGYSGAPVLSANACEKSGAGLTTLMVPEAIYPITASRCDGTVVTPLPCGADGCAEESALELILPALKKAAACVIGPGFGCGEASAAILRTVMQNAACPLVLDADALTLISREKELLQSAVGPLLLTPHEGEFSRLGGELAKGRLAGADAWMRAFPEQILILKGNGTLVCGNGRIAVNPTGTPAMAKGGSGDVLCGILCALLAQGFAPFFAAQCAVWLHGKAGEIAAEKFGEYCVVPSDLIAALPEAFRNIAFSPVV